MGNGIGKLGICFTGSGEARRAHKHEAGMYVDQYDEGLGHSFCYVRPDPSRISHPVGPPSSKIHSEESAAGVSIFRSISGASVSANTSTPLSTAFVRTPLPRQQPPPSSRAQPLSLPPAFRPNHHRSGIHVWAHRAGWVLIRPPRSGWPPLYSGPLDRSFSVQGTWAGLKPKKRAGSLIRGLRHAISKTFRQSSVAPMKVNGPVGQDNWVVGGPGPGPERSGSINMSSEMSLGESESWESQNLQWAQGKAGEDRVHVVVSEEHGWVFVGIYDGFNELKGLLWDDNTKFDSSSSSSSTIPNNSGCFSESSSNSSESSSSSSDIENSEFLERENYAESSASFGEFTIVNGNGRRERSSSKTKFKGATKKWEENQRRWKCEWDRERLELDRRLKEQWNNNKNDSEGKNINHSDVLMALSRALKKTEESYLDVADKIVDENPELALMGSCVLGMLMKGEDVYLMNVGDSRAVLAQTKEPDLRLGKLDQDLERINEESLYDFDVSDGVRPSLRAFQLTVDHSTCDEEEVQRIKDEHSDDAFAVVNDRVKGSLKVTRAFGAGYLKQYFSNQEVVAEVELFISLYPDGDPAQHLVEEVLFRAAKRFGMDFHELLEIPQGDRRRYHDDVSIIVISFEGRIWRSCV
ncbi:putative protein phosphatase 2C 23 [Bienertia sinuspersici]